MRNTAFLTEKETARVFAKMGHYVGIKATKRSQRGIIAKRFLDIIEDRKLDDFEKQIPKIDVSKPLYKVNDGGRSYYI